MTQGVPILVEVFFPTVMIPTLLGTWELLGEK